MSTTDANTLKWVKSEIDDTLTLAQSSLDAYVEDTADESQLRFCINYLHQVHGTLQMVELYGAALAIDEMEKLAQAIFDGTVSNKNDAYETLMRGILQMPDYLEHLLAGKAEMPVVLLPLLNDIRAARNERLLSEGALFTPDLTVAAPVAEKRSEGDLSDIARKLRHHFHLGLLSWFQNKNPKAGLQKISAVITALIQAAESNEARRVFWIANGLVESLKDEGVDASIAVKMLMGHVDRQIKKIIDEGVHALDDLPPEDLEKNLLYYIASSTTEGPFTTEIKEAFHLKEIMPDIQTVEQTRADLIAPNAALMGTVSKVIIDDINKIKDQLDVFVRADEKDMSALDDVYSSLIQMADTLAMLNLGEQREAVLKQADIIGALASGKLAAEEQELMTVAAAMISLEQSMAEIPIAKSISALDENGAGLGKMQAMEQKLLMQAVLEEAKINLAKVKHALTEFSSDSTVSEQLKSIPVLLEQIQGSFKILSLEDAVKLLTLTNDYIRNTLIKEQAAPSLADMNNLADAISSIEYYMESLSGDWGSPEAILDIAEQSLQALGIITDGPFVSENEPAAQMFDASSPETELSADDVSLQVNDTTDSLKNNDDDTSSNEIILDELSLDDAFLNETTEEKDVSVTEEIIPLETVVEVDVSQHGDKISTPSFLEDTIDDEIIEIFMEEADEAYQSISELLPVWIANTSDNTALKEMRRAFHTLKGSGRLVGAMDLGEFAWSFENMLNRVIDNTINVNPELIELIELGKQALPELFELFKTNGKAAENILILMQNADAFSKGESVADVISEESLPVDIDTALLEIYKKEVSTHCDSLKHFVTAWNAGSTKISSELLRALHTLTGSSRTTGVQSLAKVCGSFEKYIKCLQDDEIALPKVAVNELEETISLIENTMACLDQPGATLPEHEALLSRIEALPQDFDPVVAVTREITEEPVVDVSIPDYDEELLEIFLEEATEILDESDQTIHDWIESPDDPEFVKELQRQLHTLKGGARMAGIAALGDLGHSMESLLTVVVDGQMSASKPLFDLLLLAQDHLLKMLELVQQHKALEPASELINAVEDMLARKSVEDEFVLSEDVFAPEESDNEEKDESKSETEVVATEITAEEIIADATEPFYPSSIEISELENIEEELRLDIEALNTLSDIALPAIEETADELEEQPQAVAEKTNIDIADDEPERRKLNRGQAEQVRVRADLLDNLVNFAGEVSIYRSRLEQQTNNFRYNITEFDDTVNRLREQLRQFEIETETQIEYKSEDTLSSAQEKFDPLEMDRFTTMQHLSRAMMESLSDLDSLRGILNNLTRESETLLLQQSRVNTDLQEGLMRTRMVPFSGHAARLRRIVRQTCNELGKHADLHLEGVDSELDRTVLERIISPIEHMLRNAVAHGIETPEQRKKSGKPDSGSIHFSILNEGSDILIKIRDDGAGINLDAIRSKAIDKGLLKEDDVVSKEKLLEIIMQSGFSTAESISQIAGRGVGMDVVNTEIKQLGGVLNIDSEVNTGTTFTVILPLTLAISRALMVIVGEDTYAVPLLSVKGIERISVRKIKEILAAEEKTFNWGGEDYQFMHLGSVMGGNEMNLDDEEQQLPMLMVRSGEYRAAILVDTLLGSREIVVKPVGPQLSTLRGISGATVLGDGSVVLILDLVMLIRLVTTAETFEEKTPVTVVPEKQGGNTPLVMVVDDSITVRKVTTRLLERHRMNVISAKDGVDALAQLQEIVPDIMLLDVEMPRMDGFELATNMHNDERLKNVPIIMITSRTGQKHRDRATAIGVNGYMGKPFNEADLMENINSLLGLDA